MKFGNSVVCDISATIDLVSGPSFPGSHMGGVIRRRHTVVYTKQSGNAYIAIWQLGKD